MTDRRTFERAARWALQDDAAAEAPPLARAASATLDDPALAEALAACASTGRLSDAEVHAMRANRRRTIGAIGGLALVFAIGAGSWLIRPTPEIVQVAHLETGRGEQRTVRLADGSTLRLNGATSLDVRLAAGTRQVMLARGEAYFDIFHDPDRPFEVDAGSSSTRVLGTAFDVDMADGEVKLAVYRGRVRFGGSAAGEEGGAVLVTAGWRSRFRHGAATAPTAFDPSVQDWRSGWLDTDGMRLADLVEALNRHGGVLVQAPPGQLGSIQLAGRFKLDDSQALLEAIGGAYGFAVRREGDTIRLVPAS